MPNANSRPKKKQSPTDSEAKTSGLLLNAAIEEFRQHGFAGTDTNKIARRAGFAPQTFYRWFKDKTDVFMAVYRVWEEQEIAVLEALLKSGASDERLVDALVRHHREHLLFRRSLRQLSVEEPAVGAARAASRGRQVEQIRAWWNIPSGRVTALMLLLLQVERLTDAIVEGELKNVGVSDSTAKHAIATLLLNMQVHGAPAGE